MHNAIRVVIDGHKGVHVAHAARTHSVPLHLVCTDTSWAWTGSLLERVWDFSEWL